MCVVFGPLVVKLLVEPRVTSEKEPVVDMFLYLAGLLVPAALVLFALLGLHSVLLTHRIAGLLCRFRKAFADAAK